MTPETNITKADVSLPEPSLMTEALNHEDDSSFIQRRINFIEGQIVSVPQPAAAVSDSENNTDLPENRDRFRILYLPEKGADEGYWISTVRDGNIPESFSLAELTEKVLSGEYCMGADLSAFPKEGEISPKARKLRDDKFNAIRDIIEQEPAIYQRRGRGKLIKHAMDVSGLSYVSIYDCLGRYWKGGKDINALLPNYSACGTGRKPDFTQTKKLGRKKTYQGTNGKILTKQDLQNFEEARKDYLSSRNTTLQGAYSRMLASKYSREDSSNPGKFIQLPADEKPSFRQFYYWYGKNRNIPEDSRKKNGDHAADLNERAITGRSETGIPGPGLVAQIDGTIGDFYLVRHAHRDQIVGRPVMFFVMDVKTRMIMGMHITLENASWDSALMALKNCADNKTEYCEQYDIRITPEEWPCSFMPSSIVADNGELGGKGVETVISKLGITVENMPPYRGDLKGIIERNFAKFHMRFRDIVPGYVDSDAGTRGAEDYRLQAALSLREFTYLIIKCVLFHNNCHLMQKYARSISMIDKGIMAVPLQLWNYGIRYETGALKTLSRETILSALLPRDKASVTPCGIRFKGIYYTCPEAEKNMWYTKARIDKCWKIEAAYDPTSVRHIYIFGEDGRVITCDVLSKDLGYGNLTKEELDRYNEINRQDIASYSQQEEQGNADLERATKQLTDKAKKEGETASIIKKALARHSVKDCREQEKQDLNGFDDCQKSQSGDNLQKLAQDRELHRQQNGAPAAQNETQASGNKADHAPLSSERSDPVGKKIQDALREMGML